MSTKTFCLGHKALRRNPGRKLNKQSKIRIYRPAKTDSYSLETKWRKHLSTSEKKDKFDYKKKNQDGMDKVHSDGKNIYKCEKGEKKKIHRRGLAVNIRKYWQQNDENRRSITTKNDEF